MSSMARAAWFNGIILSDEQIKSVKELIARQPISKWVHATNIAAERGVGVTACDYEMLYDRVLLEEERQFLQSLVPVFEGTCIRTQVINRYKPGGFLCDHTDRQGAVYNTIIPLQSSDVDGFRYYEKNGAEVFVPDVGGRMTVIEDPFLIHGVPPAKKERFVLITIYADESEKEWNPYQDLYQNQSSAS